MKQEHLTVYVVVGREMPEDVLDLFGVFYSEEKARAWARTHLYAFSVCRRKVQR